MNLILNYIIQKFGQNPQIQLKKIFDLFWIFFFKVT